MESDSSAGAREKKSLSGVCFSARDGHSPCRMERLLERKMPVVPIRADSSCLLHWRIFPGATGCHSEACGRMSLEGGRIDGAGTSALQTFCRGSGLCDRTSPVLSAPLTNIPIFLVTSTACSWPPTVYGGEASWECIR